MNIGNSLAEIRVTQKEKLRKRSPAVAELDDKISQQMFLNGPNATTCNEKSGDAKGK